MSELQCVDGSLLSVHAVPRRDRAGQPFEITLELRRDRQQFASMGQCCGHVLAALAAAVAAARADPGQAAAWPDPDDRFPGAAEPGPGCSSGPGQLPGRRAGPGAGAGLGLPAGDLQYFALRSAERWDLAGGGELRCTLRASAQWQGSWLLGRRAIVEAWNGAGTGIRAILTSAGLHTFLEGVLTGPGEAMLETTSVSTSSVSTSSVAR